MKIILSITVCLLLFFVGCEKQVNSVNDLDFTNLTVEELANEVSKDSVYMEFKEITKKQFDKIKSIARSQEAPISSKSISEKQVLNQLGLDEEYWEKRQTVLMEKAEYLNSKYKLDKRSEEEVKLLFNILQSYSNTVGIVKKGDACQVQFEEDIASVHATYDFMIMYGCPTIALRTGFGGLVACSAAAVYNASLGAAQAIDDYNACMAE